MAVDDVINLLDAMGKINEKYYFEADMAQRRLNKND
jgi:hypothetical protein